MARIGVLHRHFWGMGGRESVCLQILEALAEDHSIQLLTTEQVDFERLNAYFGTDVTDIPIKTLSLFGIPGRYFDRVTEYVVGDGRLGYFREFRYVAVNRAAESEFDDLDVLIASSHEIGANIPLIQYVHFPKYNRAANPEVATPQGRVFDLLSRLVDSVSNMNELPGVILTNSTWTASVIHQVYGVDAKVVYPPIQVDEFTHRIPDNNKFVMVGRLNADKRVLTAIEIIRSVHELGYDVELEIIGPSIGDHYASRVRDAAASLDYVSVLGELPFSKYTRKLQSARYGIHAKPQEHFGMVIAEMVAAGVLPIVPNDGGQTDIIGNQPELMYATQTEAVNRISDILADPEYERKLRDALPGASRYSSSRFKDTIRTITDDMLTGHE